MAEAGADALDGGAGFDYARYDSAAAAVTADLSGVVAGTGDAAGDTFLSIEGIWWARLSPIPLRRRLANTLQGRDGNDTLEGGAGKTTAGRQRQRHGPGDAGRDSVYGEAGVDTLEGGDDNDGLYGGSGADALDGGGGFDFARYDTAAAGVTVDLSGVVAGTGDAAGDTFVSIEGIVGTPFADTVYGDALANTLQGRDGNDTLEGGAGDDLLQGGNQEDTLLGGDHNDTLQGDADATTSMARQARTRSKAAPTTTGCMAARAPMRSMAVPDFDYARYDTAAAAVTVDLSGVVAGTGDAAGDTFIAIEGVVGTQFGDTIYGDGLANTLQGRDGNDTLNGRLGIDMLVGGTGNDTFRFIFGEANGDTVSDFVGNGAAAGDALVFQGYGAGATFTKLTATDWSINYTGGSEVIHFANAAPVHASDYTFIP